MKGILSEIEWVELLKIMEEEGKKRKAPVLTLKGFLKTPFQHLIFAVLSSRTRDEQTAKVAERLFKKIKTPEDLMNIPEEELEKLLYGVGFYRVKASRLKKIAHQLVKKYNSEVPSNFSELVSLEGVGVKTANVVLAHAFGRDVIGVDTHVHRISNRLGIVKTKTPERTEKELLKVVPEGLRRRVNSSFVAFGQTVCRPIKPLCDECPLSNLCPKIGV